MMKSIIYRTKGRAREYCELALNQYSGCSHGCVYCYAPDVVHADRKIFHAAPSARLLPGDVRAGAHAARLQGLQGDVLLSFTTDPYQPLDAELRYTRTTIEILKEEGFRVSILTKAGELARRDFDLLRPGVDTFATTLTCFDETGSRIWEPNTGLPDERMKNLEEAKYRGLKTWVSFEPVIDVVDTFALMFKAAPFADHFKVGRMNYVHLSKPVGWKKFAETLVEVQPNIGRPFYLKADLAKELGHEGGLWIGGER